MPSKEWADANRQKCRDSGKRHYCTHAKVVRQKVCSRRQELRKWFKELKKTLSCGECGEQRTPCLDFHHKDPLQKEINISQSHNKGWGKERILAEIAKCEVLCSNCHRCRHAADS